MRPYNNQTIDAKIKEINPDIIRIGDYEGSIIKIKFRHNKCGYEWYIEPYLIISKKINCAKCVLRIRNNLDIDCYILQNNLPLTRIGDYIEAKKARLIATAKSKLTKEERKAIGI